MKRRSAIAGGVVVPALLISLAAPGLGLEPGPSLSPAPVADPRMLDVIVTGGRVLDGTGAPGRVAEIGIAGDRIAYVGQRPDRVTARRIVDAAGLVVAPGFIDPHTHSGADATAASRERRRLANHLLQGVTTIAIGNDGGGSADVEAVFEAIAAPGAGPNVAAFVGFGAVRRTVVGERDRPATPSERARMATLVAEAMCEGALGLSAGLYYAPQSFADTSEIVPLARAAAERGGIYETHLRDEGSASIGLMAAIEEALGIARRARLPLHIAHIKALGVDAQGMAPRVIARIEAARARGMRVTADQYPWDASSTRLASALVPRRAMDGGRAAMVARLRQHGERLRAGMAEQLRVRGGPAAILMVSGGHRGIRLDALARAWGVAPLDAAIRLLIAEPDVRIASFNMAEADIRAFARQPWVVASSDATRGHPRAYGSFARRWRWFVREERLMREAEFVRRASGLTAAILGLGDRGTLAPGKAADIVILDPARYAERATYAAPERPAIGVRHVLVNGRFAVENGRLTGALAGRPLPKPRPQNGKCPE